ncbi:hypothetical protein J6590_080808 [Homalodisca vitripennis]|nr:hypothetical protein J6590_080808 [Homalodisca vitripennis]
MVGDGKSAVATSREKTSSYGKRDFSSRWLALVFAAQISYFKLLPSDNPMRCKSWGRQREIDNMCSQKLCSKTSIRFCSPNIPGTRETQKRRPRPSSISIG